MVLSPRLYLPQSFFGLPLYIGVELILGIAILNKISGFYGILALITGHPIDFSQWLFYLSSILILPFYINGLQNVKNPNLPKFSLISLIFFADTIAGILFILFFAYQWFSTNESAVSNKPVLTPQPTPSAITETPSTKPIVPSSTASTKVKGYIPTATAKVPNAVDNFELEDPEKIVADIKAPKIELESPDVVDKDVKVSTATMYIKRAASFAIENVDAIGSLVTRDSSTAEKLASQSASETYELMTTVLTCIVVICIRIYFTLVIFSFTRLLLKSSKYGVNSDDFSNRNNEITDPKESKFKNWLHKMENKSVDVIVWIFNE